MSPHQERVVQEHHELTVKLGALDAFIDASPVFAALPQPDRVLLARQASAMDEYVCILEKRIARF